jgi:predicted AlkP superfamily pyrophosphatase or phosphodiesterase
MIRLYLVLFFLIVTWPVQAALVSQPKTSHVVLISVDGLRPDAISMWGPQKANAFYRMITEGASTFNARTDDDYTITLPNHASMITGYPVKGFNGHRLTENGMMNKSIDEIAGHHVSSIFEVLHQNSRHSAMLASKQKFNVYSQSFPIDHVLITNYDDSATLNNFLKLNPRSFPDFVFMHFAGTDRIGHQQGWSVDRDSLYMKEVQKMNGYLEKILKKINSNPHLKQTTVIIVTADHGGEGNGHWNINNPRDYTIPFIIWGKPVAKGVDLYRINMDRRKDPLDKRISYSEPMQPIRNGDAANLALSLLGLPLVEGSTIGYKKPVKVNKD